MKPRNLFLTKTAIGAMVSIAGSVIAVTLPIGTGYFVRHAESIEQKEDIKDIALAIQAVLGVVGLSGGVVALNGRYQATPDMYTPDWMSRKLGRNMDDVPTEVDSTSISGDSLPQEPGSNT
jgi:hypothetical protein